MRCFSYLLTCAVSLLGVVLGATDQVAQALPPAGADLLPVVAIVDAASALGEERIVLSGWAQVERAPPRLEGAVEVVDLEIVRLALEGASRVGFVSVAERPNDGPDYVSAGEIRSLQPEEDFPASSFFDLFVDVALPDTPFGPFLLHNEAALRLTPRQDGQEAPLDGWPPLGVTYELEPAVEPPCVPLLGTEDTPVELDFCVRNLSLGIAPEWPSFSVARGGPSRLHPADILALTPTEAGSSVEAPFLRISCAGLGLTADGCDDGTDGDQDDLDALSYGGDLPAGAGPGVSFSVGPGAQGVAGSAVEVQRNCPPAQPGVSPEAEPDEFASLLDGANQLVLDGNGPVGACSPAFPLGLIEGATVRDDLDALDQRDSSAVDGDGDGLPERPVYFSLDAASPSLDAFGFSAADVLRTADGGTPTVYASAAALGLRQGDDLDALCLRESGDDAYGAEDVLYFSLAPGSPTLAEIGAGPGDVLARLQRAPPAIAPRPPVVRESARSLGLLAADDVDALKCQGLSEFGEPNGDVNCDVVTNSIDAALVLQFDAGLLDSLSCGQNADVNGDGTVDSGDAGLVLRFEAGLIPRLGGPDR